MSGCEFCWAVLAPSLTMATQRRVTINYPGLPDEMEQLNQLVWAYEMTCNYQPGQRSKCAKNVLHYKRSFVQEAKSRGVHMSQYYNTPACDGQDYVSKFFHPQVYKWMLRTKNFWDPDNTFNHCFSIGSREQNCCPNST